MTDTLNGAFYGDKALSLAVPLQHCRIGFNDVVAGGLISASSTIAGFGAEAMQNPFTYDFWKPATLPAIITVDAGAVVTADYIGIAAHTLTGCNIVLETSDDDVTYTAATEADVLNNSAIMLLFEPVEAQYFKLTITGSFSAQSIGVLYIGEALAMERMIYGGHSPGALSRNTQFVPTQSGAGQWLGRSIVRAGTSEDYSFKNLTAAWYRTNFDPFVEHAITLPFFIAWRPWGYADEVTFGWCNEDIKPANSGTRDLMSVSFSVVGNG